MLRDSPLWMGAEVRRGMWELYSKDRKAGGFRYWVEQRRALKKKKKERNESKNHWCH